MSQIQEWSDMTTYESPSCLNSVPDPRDPAEPQNVYVSSPTSVSQLPFTVISGEYTTPYSNNSSPIKSSGNVSSPSVVSAARPRHTSGRSSSIHRSPPSISARQNESRRIEGGINKNRSSAIASPKTTKAKGRIPPVTAIVHAPQEAKKHLSTADSDMSDPSPQTNSGKRRALLNRLSTRFSSFNKPLHTSPSEIDGGDPSQAMKSAQDGSDPPSLSSFLPLSKDSPSSSLFPSKSSWAAPSVPLIFPKPKPPPLILQSSNLIFSPPSQPSLRPPPSPSHLSPVLSPPPLLLMPQRPPSMLLSASSASSSPGSPPNSATPRWVKTRPKFGPPLTPPPNYPLPSLPPSPSEGPKTTLSQDDVSWQYQERSSRRDSFLNLGESPSDHDEDELRPQFKATEAVIPLVPWNVEAASDESPFHVNHSGVCLKLNDKPPAANSKANRRASVSSGEYLTPPDRHLSLVDDVFANSDVPLGRGKVLPGHDVSHDPQSQLLSSTSHIHSTEISPTGNQRGDTATAAVIETTEAMDTAPPPIQIVLSNDVSPASCRRRSPTEYDVPDNFGSSASIRVQHLEATQPDHPPDLDSHVSERSKHQQAATMLQLQPSSALPTATSSTSAYSTTLLLTTVLRRARTQEPIFYFYESNDSDTDSSDCEDQEHHRGVAVQIRKRRRDETEGSPRRLDYTTLRKHSARLTSKGTPRAIALPAKGTNHNKQRVILTHGHAPQPPLISPTARLPFDPPSPTVKGTPVQHGRAGSGASSGSASGPHIAVRRSNTENVVMPRPAAGRQSKNTSISSLVSPPPVPLKSTPGGITSICTDAASTRVSPPSSPISLKRPGSHTFKRSEGSTASFAPASPAVETTVRISTSGGSSNKKLSDDSQTITRQQTGEGGKSISASVSSVGAAAEGKLRALFKGKSKPALAQRQQHTEPPIEKLKLPELPHISHDLSLSFAMPSPSHPSPDSYLTPSPTSRRSFFNTVVNHRSSKTSLGNVPTAGSASLSTGGIAGAPTITTAVNTTAPPSPIGLPSLPRKDSSSSPSYSFAGSSLGAPFSSVPPSPVVAATAGWQQRGVPSISRKRRDTDSSWASVSVSNGAGDEASFPFAAANVIAPSQAAVPTLSAIEDEYAHAPVGDEEDNRTQAQAHVEQGHPGPTATALEKPPSQSRFASTVNIFSKVKQRAKSLGRPEPVHLEPSAPASTLTPSGGVVVDRASLPAFLFDPQAEGTSSHAQIHAYGYGAAASSHGRSKSEQQRETTITIPPSAFRPSSTVFSGNDMGAGARPGSLTTGSVGRSSREYSPYSYADPRLVGSARLQGALERDVPANANTHANGGTVRPGSGASQAELQWSQMLFDS